MPPFDPKLQNFTLLGSDGQTSLTISMTVIDAQRLRLANICISYGVQLGLCLMALLTLLLLIPPIRMRRPITVIHISSLVVAVIRLGLLIQYFPGQLSEYYVAWTKDRTALADEHFATNTAGNAFNAVQFALIEMTLIMQSWGLIKTWPCCWKYLVRTSSILLALATVAAKSLWVVHHTQALKTTTLPVQLDAVGQAATVMGAVSIFYFCGIFAADLSVHLIATKGILARHEGGLSSFEILAIGNGILMILPSIFAGLDVAAGLSGTRILPFDAGSWVMTIVVIGLPLIGLIARHRGPASTDPSGHRFSGFANTPLRNSKMRTSQVENTTVDSPVDEHFMTYAEPTRTDSAWDATLDGMSFLKNNGGGERNGDVELNVQVHKDAPIIVDGSGMNHSKKKPKDS